MDIPASNPNVPNPNLQPGASVPEGLQPGQLEQQPTPAAAETPVAPVPAPAAAQNVSVPQQPAPVPASAPAVPAGAPAAVPTPAVADDVDVIEPEWIEKAEDVVRTHQGDPYGEEKAIEHLQVDYLKKRYGFSVAEPDSDSSKPGTG